MIIIPYLDQNPRLCAAIYPDDMVKQVPIQICLLLSRVYRDRVEKETCDKLKIYRIDTTIGEAYRHWLIYSEKNYRWLHNLLIYLCAEHEVRFNKEHPCKSKVGVLETYPRQVRKSYLLSNDTARFTQPPLTIPEAFWVCVNQKPVLNTENIASVVLSFRNWFLREVYPIARYTKSIVDKPKWLKTRGEEDVATPAVYHRL